MTIDPSHVPITAVTKVSNGFKSTAIRAFIWQYNLLSHVQLYEVVNQWTNVKLMMKDCKTNGTKLEIMEPKNTTTNTKKHKTDAVFSLDLCFLFGLRLGA